jgi:hypothetical protein
VDPLAALKSTIRTITPPICGTSWLGAYTLDEMKVGMFSSILPLPRLCAIPVRNAAFTDDAIAGSQYFHFPSIRPKSGRDAAYTGQ